MSESTVTKSKVFKEDLQLATGGTGAAEEGTRITSTGGEATLTKIDASHIKFRTVAKSLDDLVDGGNDVTLKPNSITMAGTLTLSAQTTAGYVKNSAAGVISGGNSIAANDLPSAIDAALIANGSVSNTEFQYLNGVTSAIQTQLNTLAVAASQVEQEAGTETAKYVSPAKQQYHASAAKFWAKVTGGTAANVASYNVASISDDGTGLMTLTFTTEFSSINWCAQVVYRQDVSGSTASDARVYAQASTTVQIATYQAAVLADVQNVYVVGFGDQ